MEKVSVLEVSSIRNQSVELFTGTKKYVATGDVDEQAIETFTEITYDNRPSRANIEVKLGQVLFARMKGTNKVIQIDESNQDYIYSTGFCVLEPSELVTTDYLRVFLKSDLFQIQKDKHSKGATQKAINNEGISKIKIPIPPLETQKKIVEALDKAQDLIDARKEQIRLMDELVKSRFVEMFGDPIHPIDYIKMDEVAILERGRFSPRPRNDPKYYNGLYPFIQTGDIANCNHRLSEYKQTLNEQGIRVSKLFKKGTIVMAIVGATIGATAILQIQVYAPDSVIGITVKTEKCEPVFLETLLQFWKPELQRRAPESARANINLSILNEIPIIRADINEQIVFSKFVKQIDKSKSEMKKRLDEFITTHQALMQQYFG